MRFRVKSKYLLPVPASSPTAPNGASTGTNSISQVFGPPTAQDAQLREIRERFAIARKDRILLSLQLRHGDVCVQEGAPLQKYFEHSVEPAGFRIAATARRIDAQ